MCELDHALDLAEKSHISKNIHLSPVVKEHLTPTMNNLLPKLGIFSMLRIDIEYKNLLIGIEYKNRYI